MVETASAAAAAMASIQVKALVMKHDQLAIGDTAGEFRYALTVFYRSLRMMMTSSCILNI